MDFSRELHDALEAELLNQDISVKWWIALIHENEISWSWNDTQLGKDEIKAAVPLKRRVPAIEKITLTAMGRNR